MSALSRDIVPSLILATLRGFCLTPLKSPLAKGGLKGDMSGYLPADRQVGKKPLEHYTPPYAVSMYLIIMNYLN